VSDPALKEIKGFAVDKLVGANDGGLVTPPACVPALGAPNRVVVLFPAAPAVGCP